MLTLELVVVLGVVVLTSEVVARRLRTAPLVLLLSAGAMLALVPALREVHLPPRTVLLLFLPALLWWESLNTSLRDIRRSLRGVVLVSTLLVAATAAAAATVHTLVVPWGPAWVLGAALAPTDATAVSVLATVLPRSMTTILRVESLVNDGTALVLCGLAVAVTAGSEHVTAPHVTRLFVVSYVGGAVAGLLTAVVATAGRRRLDDPLLENVVILLTPFVAYLLAEEVDASGVLAVVVAGLVTS